MKKILKHMKPYAGFVVIIVMLLFVQAWADLKLPSYMSSIVNVGIQQNGIENASPETITENSMALVESILPLDQALVFKGSYNFENNQWVIKQDIDRERTDILMGDTVWTLIEMSQGLPGSGSGALTQDMDIQVLYAMIPNFQMISQDVKEAAYERVQAIEPSLRLQSGIVLAKLMYQDVGKDVASLQKDYIVKTGLSMLGVTLIGVIAAVGVGYAATRTGAGFSKRLRRDVFEKTQSLSSAEFNKFSPSSLVVRTVNDVTQVQMMVMMSLRMFIYAPIMAIGGLMMIQNKADNMTWIIAVACVALLVVLIFVYLVAVPKFKIRQKLVDKVNQVFRENLSGLLVIRAFGNSKFEKQRFALANEDVASVTLFINRVMAFMMPIMTLILNLTVIGIIGYGSYQVNDGLLQIGDMMAFMSYAMQIIMSFLMISMMFVFIPRAMVSLNRIEEVLDTDNSILESQNPRSINSEKKGYVEFDNVSFKYDGADEPVLENISFVAKPGQTTAIIGSTGSGKSTIINLIPRFYDVNEGSVKVSGVDVRDLRLHDLRQDIGYVPQKGVLHTGSVESNLKYGRPEATNQEVLDALAVAQGNFVLDNEKGLDFEITQGGTNVSGGQRQRLSIARALVKNASIYIFDDSFSALDYKTDRKLRDALHEHYSDATLIIVAQRVNTILEADQILVVDEGKLVGKGTHVELLRTCPTYYEIASSQLSKEELDYAWK